MCTSNGYSMRFLLWGVTVTAAFAVSSAQADENHYRNILVGERASGMGGAYTAVSDSPAGMYYNPAGVVYAAGGSVTASVSTYDYVSKSYARGLSGLDDWERRSTSFVPSFFGMLQPLGEGVIGISYAMPDAVTEDQDLEFSDAANSIRRYVVNFNNQDRTFQIGPSYARRITEDLSIGASVYFHYREREWISNQLTELNSGLYQINNTYFQTNEYGYKPVLGLMWSPLEKWAFGASLSKVTIYEGKADSQVTARSTANALTFTKAATEDKREHPLNANLGAAYFHSPALMVAVDAAYYEQFTDPVYGERESVVNVSLGGEYYLNPVIALRAGVFTDYTNAPELVASRSNQTEHVDYLGFSLSVTHFTRNASLTMGGVYRSGDGQAQIVGGSNEIQDVTYTGASLFITSGYSY